MKVLRTLLLIVFVAALSVTAALFYQRKTTTRTLPETKTVDIQGTITDIGELATAEYNYTITKVTEKPSKTVASINIPFTSGKVLYSYEGVIKAGIQFSSIEITESPKQKIIYVRLPNAEILSAEVDNDSLVIYDEQYSVFNTFTFSDFNISMSDAKEAAVEAAVESGILERAIDNARVLITTTLSAIVDLDEYEIVFY